MTTRPYLGSPLMELTRVCLGVEVGLLSIREVIAEELRRAGTFFCLRLPPPLLLPPPPLLPPLPRRTRAALPVFCDVFVFLVLRGCVVLCLFMPGRILMDSVPSDNVVLVVLTSTGTELGSLMGFFFVVVVWLVVVWLVVFFWLVCAAAPCATLLPSLALL